MHATGDAHHSNTRGPWQGGDVGHLCKLRYRSQLLLALAISLGVIWLGGDTGHIVSIMTVTRCRHCGAWHQQLIARQQQQGPHP